MKTYLIDLDGTMYHGNENIDGAREFIEYLQKTNQKYLFLTNNATRTKKQNKEHLEQLGFKNIKEDDFFTSSMAAAKYIAEISEKRKAFVVGQDGLLEALKNEAFEIVEENADFVFVGLDFAADYNKYSKALQNLLSGAKLIATNKDRRLPSGGTFRIGNGAVVVMLEYASGQEALVTGKPYVPILNAALVQLNITINDIILIGDNLETDVALGYYNNVETIFVTTGVHDETDCERLEIFPTKTVKSLHELIKQ